jgi:SAM-dependent methyltransferase
MKFAHSVLERSAIYRAWQAPFRNDKLAPLCVHNDLSRVRRVLDVGCGPGTNTRLFTHSDYLGIDLNPDYIAFARKRFGRQFIVADAVNYEVPGDQAFDFILVNSFFHHVDTGSVCRILSHLRTLLSPGGHIHILDLVLPDRASIARLLARLDRGRHARRLEEWRRLFSEHFELAVFEPYPLKVMQATLWNMVYCKGAVKR